MTRFFFAGPLFEGSTCTDRLRSLRRLGIDAVSFDTNTTVASSNSLFRSIAWRFYWGPAVSKLNRDLLACLQKDSAFTHVWIEKGVWIWPETIRAIKRTTGATIVHYTPDPGIIYHRSRHFLSAVPLYDILFTTKTYEIDRYREAGAKQVVLTQQGIDTTRFYPHPFDKDLACDVLFIGHLEDHYQSLLERVASSGILLKIWGPGWTSRRMKSSILVKHIQGNGLWGENYPRALSSAKICLGLLSKLIPDSVTTRSFEIPACRSLLLAERTTDHQQLFREAHEADFFSSVDEMMQKIHYYLHNSDIRTKLANEGHSRCLNSGYTIDERLKEILRVLKA